MWASNLRERDLDPLFCKPLVDARDVAAVCGRDRDPDLQLDVRQGVVDDDAARHL
ncbi:MAG TPA: hypothetical protein PK336_04445 [Methanoculleus sp.]|nr:hypothetical protein [Methanoculleus sp.]